MSDEKYSIEKCNQCPPEDHEGNFCRCEPRNIEVAKMLREIGKSPWIGVRKEDDPDRHQAEALKPFVMQHITGIDHIKEIFDLWYEVTFLRMLMGQIIGNNPELSSVINNEVFEKCRQEAQKHLNNKFKIDLAFQKPKTEDVNDGNRGQN